MITYTEEPIVRCRADIEALLPDQWEETGDTFIECRPNWPMYEALETAGALLSMMAREDGRLVGYLAGSVYGHPNSSGHKIGSIPTYYVEERNNRAMILKSLISHGVNLALNKGAVKVLVKTEYNHSAGRILEAMGMVPTAVEYVMTRRQELRYA